MILSDNEIFREIKTGGIEIEPFEPDNVEPASVDLRLGNEFIFYTKSDTPIDTRSDDIEYGGMKDTREYVVLLPGETVLATTKERISIPNYLGADVKGRSTIGRLFVEVHQTAGWIDPGWNGEITLEIVNHNKRPVILYEGQRVCQIIFKQLSSPASKPYGHAKSQYQNQSGVTPPGTRFD